MRKRWNVSPRASAVPRTIALAMLISVMVRVPDLKSDIARCRRSANKRHSVLQRIAVISSDAYSVCCLSK
jgi:hypothetical protein